MFWCKLHLEWELSTGALADLDLSFYLDNLPVDRFGL